MSLTSTIVVTVVQQVVGHLANDWMAQGLITAADARTLVDSCSLVAQIGLKVQQGGSQSTADQLKAIDARLKALEHK